MLGVANGLLKSGVLDELAGQVTLIAVPAEEFVEIASRDDLRREGKLEFLGGKAEFIKLGAFDNVDMAMMVHGASIDRMAAVAGMSASNNGFIGKQARFVGKAAHAGGAPHDGINALYAANIALSAINAQRETFKDDDTVRIHPILTRAGDLVNVIPERCPFRDDGTWQDSRVHQQRRDEGRPCPQGGRDGARRRGRDHDPAGLHAAGQ